MKNLLALLFIVALCSCSPNSETDKYQSERNNIINVNDKVKDVDISHITMSGAFPIYIINDYLIIADYKSYGNQIKICDKNTFKHIASTAPKGRGRGEIITLGCIGIDEINRVFYVTDHGNNKIFKYELDSVISNPKYQPTVKMEMEARKFMSVYQFINDTLSIGALVEPTGNSGFNQSVAKWNMNTGEIDIMKYKHPDIATRRVNVAVSPINDIYVESHIRHNLMTICNLDGELKYNIYGDDWSSSITGKRYYGGIEFYDDKIIQLFSGNNRDNKGGKSIYPTKFLIFDIEGNYIKTWETEYNIMIFKIDKDNNRILMVVDEEQTSFAYLDMDGLL